VKWWSHEVSALLLIYALAPWIPASALLVPLVFLGAVFPDIIEDLLFAKHRSLHELAIYLALPPILVAAGHPYLLAFAYASIDHVLVDAMTKQGVKVFGRRVRWVLKTNRLQDNFVPVLLHAVLVYLVSGGSAFMLLASPH
jgi:membrane-bound metal-dependent hydrolase YbcI (DUF457 family)